MRLRIALAVAVAAIAVVNVLNAAVLVSWRYDIGKVSGWLLLARENNPSTWLTSALFLVAAALAASLAGGNGGWWLIAAGLALVSLDETASVHERLVDASSWMLVFAPVAAIAVVVLWRLWPTVDQTVRRGLLAAGAVYIGGAFVVENVAQWWRRRQGDQDLTYHAISTVEENLEFLGVLITLAVLAGAVRRAGGIHLTLRQ